MEHHEQYGRRIRDLVKGFTPSRGYGATIRVLIDELLYEMYFCETPSGIILDMTDLGSVIRAQNGSVIYAKIRFLRRQNGKHPAICDIKRILIDDS